MNIEDSRLDTVSLLAVVAGLTLGLVGWALLNAAADSADPGGNLAWGWIFLGVGGMAMQAGFVGYVLWLGLRVPQRHDEAPRP